MGLVLRLVIGVGFGAALGGLVGVLVRSSSRAAAFISTPGRGAFFGAVVGLVFALYIARPIGWRPEGESHVLRPSAETFEETVAGEEPAVVVFYSDACPPCHRLAPRVERLADAYAGRVTVARVDVDKEKALSDRFGIRAVPTVIYFAGGEAVGGGEGLVSYGGLRERAEELIAAQAALPRNPPPEPTSTDEGPTEPEEPTQ